MRSPDQLRPEPVISRSPQYPVPYGQAPTSTGEGPISVVAVSRMRGRAQRREGGRRWRECPVEGPTGGRAYPYALLLPGVRTVHYLNGEVPPGDGAELPRVDPQRLQHRGPPVADSGRLFDPAGDGERVGDLTLGLL